MSEFSFFENLMTKVDYLTALMEQKDDKSLQPAKPMSVLEAAEYLNLSKQGIYNRVYLRTIPFHKNGKLYFLKNELDQFVNGEWQPDK